jgi:deoxyribonuclease-4
MKYIGAHVSTSGGVDRAPGNARAIGARAFGLFLKNQRRWESKPYANDTLENFKHNCAAEGIGSSAILPHDSYLINLGHPETKPLQKARAAFLDEMRRCERLGLEMLNFHPGNHLNKISEDECIERIAESVNLSLSQTRGVTAVIENTAGQGSSIGYDFEHLAKIIEKIEDKRRIGVCLDTCHCFAAGYDLRSPDAFDAAIDEFDSVVGLGFLRAFHLNDSKREKGSRVDRHENLGEGTLGMEPFRMIMRNSRFDDMPLILETPDSSRWPEEIELLYSFIIR